MKVGEPTIRAVARLMAGESGLSPKRNKLRVIEFLNGCGADLPGRELLDGSPFPEFYSESKLREFNGTATIGAVITGCVNPAEYTGTAFDHASAVTHLNEHLAHDGLELVRAGRRWKLAAVDPSSVVVSTLGESADPLSHEFIREQLAKCERKLGEDDNDGAITNARALVEGVLRELERRISGTSTDTSGDLLKQYKTVQKLLNLQPERQSLHESLRQMLTGLVSIVNGIAAARNAMSDAHARTYKPAPHDARLVVNSANTLADFLLASYEVQRDRGVIKPSGRA